MGSTAAEAPAFVLSEVVKTDVMTVIDPEVVSSIISSPPFVSVPGCFNTRDVSHPLAESFLRRNFIFRSGMLSLVSEEGKSKLASELGLKTIFDLRAAKEREKLSSPEIDGVETRWVPFARDATPIDYGDFPGSDAGVSGMVKMYWDFSETHVPPYRAVFEHIRDRPEEPCLFHCNAGKDRTGVLAALILQISGCPVEAIAEDYTLTRIGLEPGREVLIKSLLSGASGEPDPEKIRVVIAISSVHYETMVRFLKELGEKYEGGAEGYVKTALGFSGEDVEKIKQNLKARA